MKTVEALSDLISAGTVSVGFPAESGGQVLDRIARMVTASGPLSGIDPEAVLDSLKKREALSSTSCGHGVAIPHCRIAGTDAFAAGLVVTEAGIDFGAADGQSVRLFPFIIGPESSPRTHLRYLSSLAQIFRNDSVRELLLKASGPEEACRILREKASPKRSAGEGSEKRLVMVFIQDETVFDEVLQVFATAETSSSFVMEADESTGFLRNMPLYAGFWNTDIDYFNRLIVSVVREELVNAVIRNIEFICGPLSEREDVMLTVTGLLSVHGSLGS